MTITTQVPVRESLDEIAGREHATAGYVIGLAGASATALAQGCARASQAAGVAAEDVHARLEEIRAALLRWADEDAEALGKMIALREQGREAEGWAALMEGPVAMADLACDGAEVVQHFRPRVAASVRDDLEFSVLLLAAAARAALLLLQSNLRQYRRPEIHNAYGQQAERLQARLSALRPVDCIAWRE